MAVYTPLSESEIAAFLMHYNVGELVSFTGIAEGIENTNYLLTVIPSVVEGSNGAKDPSTRKLLAQDDTKKYILTVYEKRVSEEELPFFMELTAHLAARGIACPQPVVARGGETIHKLAGKPAALIEFLSGKGSPQITEAHTAQLGELCAKMHLAAKNFPRSRRNTLSVGGWNNLFKKFEASADQISAGLGEEISAELSYLRAHWPCDLPMGVVHTDLFPDNVFFEGTKLSGVIDFYFACTDSFAYDLIIAMNAWCFDEKFAFVPARAKAIFDAYQKVRALTDEEKEMLPVLARGAAMRFLVTRCYDWLNRPEGALVTPKNPMEYVAKLRFHQQDDQITRLLDNQV